MEVVIINGGVAVGKDSFVEAVKSIIGEFRCFNYSTVDFVKFVATCAGWKGNKTPENRLFLSNLKKLLTEWDDIPFKKTAREIQDAAIVARNNGCLNDSVIFIHCREPEEIERLANVFVAHTLLIERPSDEQPSNESDANVFDYDYEVVVENTGDLELLRESARTYITEILGLTV